MLTVIPSHMVPLGAKAHDFTLFDPVNEVYTTFEELKSPVGTVVMFICNHCPFVKSINNQLVRTVNSYMLKNISFVAINSNDVSRYPEDAPEKMREIAIANAYPFPYLYDETQQTAREYQAACTPDFFVYDGDHTCIYRGQFDDSRPGNGVEVTGADIRQVLDCLMEGKPIPTVQKPSIGCGIKWKR